jgi:hypothetical protein
MFELVPGEINVLAVYIVVNVLCNFSDVGFDFLPGSFGEDISLLWLLFTVVWFNKHVIKAGDFNCPDIDWVNMEVQQALLDITSEYGLTQIHDKSTRKGNMLDLVFTNNPSLIKTTGNAPGISDHDIVITDSIIKPHYCKQQPQKQSCFLPEHSF